MSLPTRREVSDCLTALAYGNCTPEEASQWAFRYIKDDDDCDDRLLWNALITIGGADAFGGNRQYLYGTEDFKEWLLEFSAANRKAESALANP